MKGLLLALDGALGPLSAALVSGDGACLRSASADGNDALERGLAAIAWVLGDVRTVDLAALAVTTGPGFYTGLRIAISYAKALALASGVPLVGVSSYDVVEAPDAPLPRVALVRGRAGWACARLRTADAVHVTCAEADAVAATIAQRVGAGNGVWAGGAVEDVAPRLGERGIIVRLWASNTVPPALALARAARDRSPLADPRALEADYGA